MLTKAFYGYAERRYAECHYAECRGAVKIFIPAQNKARYYRNFIGVNE